MNIFKQKKIEIREKQNQELSKTMRLMLKNDYEQRIKLKNEELEKSRKDTEMSQLQYELDSLNNKNKRSSTDDQLFEKIVDKSKEIELETQKRQNDKVIKQIMNNTYNSLKTYDLEDVDKSMLFLYILYTYKQKLDKFVLDQLNHLEHLVV